jgi:Superinfection immunity protein
MLAQLGIRQDDLNGGVIFWTLVFFYFLPTVVAFARGHQSSAAIMLTNLFFGWTFVGWCIAAIWSVTGLRKPTIIYVNSERYSERKTKTVKPVDEEDRHWIDPVL